MEGLQKWDIVRGPARLRAGREARFSIQQQLLPDYPVCIQHELTILLFDVQPIRDAAPKVGFLSGRLFGNGEVTAVWGSYDPSANTGELWLLPVPKPYTGYSAGHQKSVAVSA